MRSLEDDPQKYSADYLSTEYGIQVQDPDGWRNAGVWWDEPLTRSQFYIYAMNSTIEIVNFTKFKTMFFHPPISRTT